MIPITYATDDPATPLPSNDYARLTIAKSCNAVASEARDRGTRPMKTHLHLAPHSVLSDAFVVELWHDDKLIGTVTCADGPGVRVISKHPAQIVAVAPMVTEVRIDPERIAM